MKLWSDIVRCPGFAACSAAGRLDRCRTCQGFEGESAVDNFRIVNRAEEVSSAAIPMGRGGDSDPGKQGYRR